MYLIKKLLEIFLYKLDICTIRYIDLYIGTYHTILCIKFII